MNHHKTHLDATAFLVLIVLCASWGFQQVAVKLIIEDVSPVMQGALRSFGAFFVVLLFLVSRRRAIFAKDSSLWWGMAAGLMFSAQFLLIYWGLEFTNASRTVVFLYLAPFVVAAGGQILFPSEKLKPMQFMGLGCSFLGLVITFWESLTLEESRILIGDAMIIAAAVIWGCTTLLIKASPLSKVSPAKILLYQLSISAVLLALGTHALDEPGIVEINGVVIASLLYQTLWVAALTYAGWFWLMQRYPVAKLSSFSFLAPVFGVFAGIIVLDEPMTVALVAGVSFVGAGIYLVNRR